MTGKNYHPENNINQNNNIVVLQIPLKIKEIVEMKNQLHAHNPRMKVE